MAGSAREPYVAHRDDLAVNHELQGFEHGGTGISLIFVDNSPGEGSALHRHRYDELFIVQDWQATFTAGGREIVAGPGHVVFVPAGQPHGFVNSGDGPLRQIAIHQSPRYETEWLTRDGVGLPAALALLRLDDRRRAARRGAQRRRREPLHTQPHAGRAGLPRGAARGGAVKRLPRAAKLALSRATRRLTISRTRPRPRDPGARSGRRSARAARPPGSRSARAAAASC